SAASTTMQTDSAILSQIEILTSTRLAAVVVDKLKLDQNEAFMNPPQSALAQGIGLIRGLIQYVRPSPVMPGVGDISKLDPAARDALIAASGRDYAILKLQNEIQADRVGRSYVIAPGSQAR
ncbi:chain-length determining protein, partial [Mesorhizobium sp. M00.F.Ca.ET.158.01.1.1]